MIKKKLNKVDSFGFTLIELLVVIAIIGLLASTVLASMSSARDSASDARRLSEAKQLQNALELYALKNNGLYPCAANSNPGAGVCDFASTNSSGGLAYGMSVLAGPTTKDTALMTALGYTPSADDSRSYWTMIYRVNTANSKRDAYSILVYKKTINDPNFKECVIIFNNSTGWSNYPKC